MTERRALLIPALLAFGAPVLAAPAEAPVAAPAPAPSAPEAPVAAPGPAPSAPEAPVAAPGPTTPPPPPALLVTPQVEVIGRRPRALDRVPGTASVVKREDLRQLAAQSAAEALRTQPGVNVLPEDGMGLRLNIGVRGLDPSRSRKVLVLEDGAPVSLNPYGSPELYYSPAIERMERLEIVKGSGQILWGPQTIGGVINYITRDPPRRLTATGDLRYGSFNYLLAQAGVGATHGPIGWRVDAIHRRFDGPRRLDMALTDVTGKLRLQLAPRSVLGVKLGFYDEGSRATYVGPTTAQLAADPRFNPAENDRFQLRRYALGLTHQHAFTEGLVLQTTGYGYLTDRVWRRQLYDRSGSAAAYERACDPDAVCGAPGDPALRATSDRSSLFFLPGSALRDRSFAVAGVEPRLTWSWAAPRMLTGELTALVRFHYERARSKIVIGSTPTAESGDVQDDEIRNGYALAAALQSRFSLWERLHITPGLRLESFWSDRRIVRAPQATGSGASTLGADVDVFGGAYSWALIPGIGVAADVAGPLTLYAGAHRGYAPPRTQDAVGPAGENLNLDPELSWNFELGARLRLGRWLSADVSGFHIEFQNQIIPPSQAGATVSGGAFNAGHSRHSGLEASVTFDPAALLPLERAGLALPLTVNYTYLPLAAFVGGRFDGNRLPYAPEHLLYAQLRLAHRSGASAQVGLTYVSAQFADRENTLAPSRDGLLGEVPGYAVLDARVAYAIRRAGLTLYLAGKNLTNQVYIASRAPEGIQPAGYLQLFGGVEGAWSR